MEIGTHEIFSNNTVVRLKAMLPDPVYPQDQKTPQSFNISGANISNVQFAGQAGRDINTSQSQQIGDAASSKSLTSGDVVVLLGEIEALLKRASIPENEKAKAIRGVECARDEAQEENPNKESAVSNLQRVTKVLKGAGETVDAGTSLWDKVKPILETISPWLGVAAGFWI